MVTAVCCEILSLEVVCKRPGETALPVPSRYSACEEPGAGAEAGARWQMGWDVAEDL